MADDFRTTEVGGRYAQALFDLADETGALDAVRGDLASLKAAWLDSADLRRLAQSPVISTEDQAKGLSAVADDLSQNRPMKPPGVAWGKARAPRCSRPQTEQPAFSFRFGRSSGCCDATSKSLAMQAQQSVTAGQD